MERPEGGCRWRRDTRIRFLQGPRGRLATCRGEGRASATKRIEAARALVHRVTDAGMACDRDASALDARGLNQSIEHWGRRPSRQIESKAEPPSSLNHARHVDAAAAGIVALSPGSDLWIGSNFASLRSSVDGRVQGQGNDGLHDLLPSSAQTQSPRTSCHSPQPGCRSAALSCPSPSADRPLGYRTIPSQLDFFRLVADDKALASRSVYSTVSRPISTSSLWPWYVTGNRRIACPQARDAARRTTSRHCHAGPRTHK